MTGNIVSFDIGSAQIKLVWCAGGVCKAAVSAPVPDGLVRGGTIVSMDAMADLLRQLADGRFGEEERASDCCALHTS